MKYRCPYCPLKVPVISQRLANKVLARVKEPNRAQVTMRAMEWLTTRHHGIEHYEGINGRPYTIQEADAIALDTEAVSNLTCPFYDWGEGECVVGGLGPHYNEAEEANKPPYTWLPTMVALTYDHDNFKRLAAGCYVADAKIALLTRNTMFLSKAALTRA